MAVVSVKLHTLLVERSLVNFILNKFRGVTFKGNCIKSESSSDIMSEQSFNLWRKNIAEVSAKI